MKKLLTLLACLLMLTSCAAAEQDAAVTPMPNSMPRMRVLASFSSVFSSLAPAKLSIAPPSTFIPYRNKPMPPIRLIQL